MAARITQVVVEVARNAVPNARVTQVAVEAVYNFVCRARVTQVAVEVLRSPEPPDVTHYHAGGAVMAGGAGPIYYAD